MALNLMCPVCHRPQAGVCARCQGIACTACDHCFGCGGVICWDCDTEPTPEFSFAGDSFPHPHNGIADADRYDPDAEVKFRRENPMEELP